QLVELHALPLVARVVVALGALDLNAEEDPRRLGGPFVGGVGAGVADQEKELAVLVRLVRTELPVGRDHGAGDLVPPGIVLQLAGHPLIEGTSEPPPATVGYLGLDDVASLAGPGF